MKRLFIAGPIVCLISASVFAEEQAIDMGELRKRLQQVVDILPPETQKPGGVSLSDKKAEAEKKAVEDVIQTEPKKEEAAAAEKVEVASTEVMAPVMPTAPEVRSENTVVEPAIAAPQGVVTEAPGLMAVEPVVVAPQSMVAEAPEKSSEKVPQPVVAVQEPAKGPETAEIKPAASSKKTSKRRTKKQRGSSVATQPSVISGQEQTLAAQEGLDLLKQSAEPAVRSGDIDDSRIKTKMRESEKMVQEAEKFFKTMSLGNALRVFEQDARWKSGDLYVTVFDETKRCLLDNGFGQRIWQDFSNPMKDQITGLPEADSFVDQMFEIGDSGGWVSYEWDFGARLAYAKTVQKHGRQYSLSVGFYPDSQRFAVQQMVKRAVRYAMQNGAFMLFEQINNPRGMFVYGDQYLWVYDFDGVSYAHGRNIAYVGQNRIEWTDSSGSKRNRKIIALVQAEGRGWVEYLEDGLPKTAYVEGFVDPRTGKRYIVGGGYYPTINDEMVKNFVKRAINHLQSSGADVAFRDFSSYAGKFVQGPLRLFAYDLQGNMLADAENPIFIGQNLINAADPEGKPIVKKILEVVKTGGNGWVTFKDKNAYKSAYVEYVEVPDGKFVIGAGYWPASKDRSAEALVEKAESYLATHELGEALRLFSSPNNEWIKGDLCVSVYSDDGICFIKGQDFGRIWHDEKKHLDAKGYSVFDTIRSTAHAGGGWIEYPMYDKMYRAHVALVEKGIPAEIQERAQAEQQQPKEGVAFGTMKVTSQESDELEVKKTEAYIVSVGYFI